MHPRESAADALQADHGLPIASRGARASPRNALGENQRTAGVRS